MKPNLRLPPEIHIIGCGGGGSWIFPALIRVATDSVIHLWDADVLEPKNLDRQLFSEQHIGMNKAEALKSIYGGTAEVHEEYFFHGSRIEEASLIICCADNHVARRACLDKADEIGGRCLIAGNEYTEAEAYFYAPEMKNTLNDPRVFAPEILTDTDGDPRSPEGCTGTIIQEKPQLVIANITAIDFALRLMWFWFAERFGLDNETKPFWPVHYRATPTRVTTVLFNDRQKEKEAQ